MIPLPLPRFSISENRLHLLTPAGRAFLGFRDSSSPEITLRAKKFFSRLDNLIGFPNSSQGIDDQGYFNLLLRYAYPEIMIDLADMLYVQHERLMVFLNFDHIHINLLNDPKKLSHKISPQSLFQKMEFLFQKLVETIKSDTYFEEDEEVLGLLAESYSFYMHQTKNFPWDCPPEEIPNNIEATLDVATGLTGFSIIDRWPYNAPKLYLSDRLPFILKSLEHFRNLCGNQNVEVLNFDFPSRALGEYTPGVIWANNFLHHLQRADRKNFLTWTFDTLPAGGTLRIIDTDLEYQILQHSRSSTFAGKLIPGYLKTLVDVEPEFCVHLKEDVCSVGFRIEKHNAREYLDETDAYSLYPEDHLKLRFTGVELMAVKPV